MHVGLLAEVDDRPEEVEEALKGLEGLEDLDERRGAQLLVVLGGNLHADLQVLSDVVRQHGADALQAVFHAKRAEEVHQPLGVEQVRVHDSALDVKRVLVVLNGALQKASLLAELGDVLAIVVREHLVAQDGIGHLRSA